MLTDREVRELLDYSSTLPVLSVYLGMDVAEGNAEVHKLHLRNLLKDVNLPQD
jgi:hypothetical protein